MALAANGLALRRCLRGRNSSTLHMWAGDSTVVRIRQKVLLTEVLSLGNGNGLGRVIAHGVFELYEAASELHCQGLMHSRYLQFSCCFTATWALSALYLDGWFTGGR